MSRFGYFLLFVEVSNIEVSAAHQRLKVCKLENPGPYATPRWIESFLMQVDSEKYVLKDILGFGSVTKDAK